MAGCGLWVLGGGAAALAHNGVIHKPGDSSSIGVSAAFLPDCPDCFTVYNYGQNYVRVVSASHAVPSRSMKWPNQYLPFAATVVGDNAVLAQADTADGNRFLVINGTEEHAFAPDSGCFDADNIIVFVDPVPGEIDTPAAMTLDNGKVYTVDVDARTCALHSEFPNPVSGPALMGDGARFYGYAESSALRCWFYGLRATGSVVECFLGSANSTVFASQRLDDGHVLREGAPFHSGGDIFFGDDDCLYVANGDTNPGSLHEPRVQSASYSCGKVLRYCNIAGGLAERTMVGVGLRHPWTSVRISNDRRVIGDVGHDTCEEASVMRLNSPAGRVVNFGWPKFECNILRGAVTPYYRDAPETLEAAIIFTDNHRANFLDTYTFIVYTVFFVALGAATAFLCILEQREPYQVVALLAALTVGLPQMASAPGYTGHDNGVYATHIRTLVPTMGSLFPEWYVMVVFIVLTEGTMLAGAVLKNRRVVGFGSLCALVYLITFVALISLPATITPLPVVAFVFIAVLWYTLTLEDDDSGYESLE